MIIHTQQVAEPPASWLFSGVSGASAVLSIANAWTADGSHSLPQYSRLPSAVAARYLQPYMTARGEGGRGSQVHSHLPTW